MWWMLLQTCPAASLLGNLQHQLREAPVLISAKCKPVSFFLVVAFVRMLDEDWGQQIISDVV